MKHTLVLLTALVALTLTSPHPSEARYKSHQEGMCEAYGTFVYNRAMDRKHGMTLAQALNAVHQWDLANKVQLDIHEMHLMYVHHLYSTPTNVSPEQHRDMTESVCLEAYGLAPPSYSTLPQY